MSDILFVIWVLFILAVAGILLYSFIKRKTDAKALRLLYLTTFFGTIILSVWVVADRYFAITDTADDWFLYIVSIFILLIIVEAIYAGATKKDKTPQQKILFKIAIGCFIIAFIAFLVLMLLITT